MSPAIANTTYRLGDVIPLEDLLALPPDGKRYGRDARGRLCLMSPERVYHHRFPISVIDRWLGRTLPDRLHVLCEGSIALPRLVRLDGEPVPPSRLGPRGVEADVAVFDGFPRAAGPSPEQAKSALVDGLRLVVEVISEATWGADLGLGEGDVVDRWRSYLFSGVPELWVVNAGVEACPLPPGTGLFLRNAGDAWVSLEADGAVHTPGAAVHGLQPVSAGRVRSGLGCAFDVAAWFAQVQAALDAAREEGSRSPS